MRGLAVLVAALAACRGEAAAAESVPVAAPPPAALAPEHAALLTAWYEAVGPRRPRERFGQLVARTGRVQLGRPYASPPDRAGLEVLTTNLTAFDCQTFVESSLAVARCTWNDTRDVDCFRREVEDWRYRDGKLTDFASRLHYFVEWLDDNAARGRLRLLTRELGGEPVVQEYFWVTRHPEQYPAISDAAVRAQIAATELRLSEARAPMITKSQVRGIEDRLADGDVIAFVGNKPGLFVTHTGLVERGADGVVRVLHASGHHGRVILTSASLANYVERREERRGLLLARPLAPDAAQAVVRASVPEAER